MINLSCRFFYIEQRMNIHQISSIVKRSGVVFATSIALISCGGGDDSGGSATSTNTLTTNPTSLSYAPAAAAPRIETKTLTATFSGDFVVLGYAPGVTPPSWVGAVTTGTVSVVAGKNVVSFAIPVNATGLAAGSYSSSFRAVTGNGTSVETATNIKFIEVPVTLVTR